VSALDVLQRLAMRRLLRLEVERVQLRAALAMAVRDTSPSLEHERRLRAGLEGAVRDAWRVVYPSEGDPTASPVTLVGEVVDAWRTAAGAVAAAREESNDGT
jgi:hypothetical protein